MTGTAPEAGLLLIALELTGPLLVLTVLVGAASIKVDHKAVHIGFWVLAVLSALFICIALSLSPQYGWMLVTGRLVTVNGTEAPKSSWYVPWTALAIAAVPLIRLAVRRQL